jgi:hypothetical protein
LTDEGSLRERTCAATAWSEGHRPPRLVRGDLRRRDPGQQLGPGHHHHAERREQRRDPGVPHEFDINAVYWNASDDVTGLTLLAAFDTNTLQDHFASWNPIQTDIMADGFGNFEFGLTDGLGENDPNSIMPGDSITFVMAIDGPCADALNCDMTDFFAANPKGYVAAAKFASGPNDPEAPGTQDSAWGAAIPEPGSAGLLGLGLAALFIGRRLRG